MFLSHTQNCWGGLWCNSPPSNLPSSSKRLPKAPRTPPIPSWYRSDGEAKVPPTNAEVGAQVAEKRVTVLHCKLRLQGRQLWVLSSRLNVLQLNLLEAVCSTELAWQEAQLRSCSICKPLPQKGVEGAPLAPRGWCSWIIPLMYCGLLIHSPSKPIHLPTSKDDLPETRLPGPGLAWGPAC